MRGAVQYVLWGVGLWLNLLVIAAMLRGAYRKYRFAFAYAVVLLLTTVVEIAAFTAPQIIPKATAEAYYWYDEIILDALVFCMVVAFIDEAAADAQRRTRERRWIIVAAAIFCLASFLIHREPKLNLRMTLVSRNMNACAVVLDVVLWSLLIAARRPNRRLLLLSGGLGIQLTGAVMGESLRHLSKRLVHPGAYLEVLTFLLGLFVWWRAFRQEATEPASALVLPQAGSGDHRTRLVDDDL